MSATVLSFARAKPVAVRQIQQPACGHVELFKSGSAWFVDDVSASGDSRAVVAGPFTSRRKALAAAELQRAALNRLEVLG